MTSASEPTCWRRPCVSASTAAWRRGARRRWPTTSPRSSIPSWPRPAPTRLVAQRWREATADEMTHWLGSLRRVALVAGRRLVARGALADAEAALFLEVDELVDALRGEGDEPAPLATMRRAAHGGGGGRATAPVRGTAAHRPPAAAGRATRGRGSHAVHRVDRAAPVGAGRPARGRRHDGPRGRRVTRSRHRHGPRRPRRRPALGGRTGRRDRLPARPRRRGNRCWPSRARSSATPAGS